MALGSCQPRRATGAERSERAGSSGRSTASTLDAPSTCTAPYNAAFSHLSPLGERRETREERSEKREDRQRDRRKGTPYQTEEAPGHKGHLTNKRAPDEQNTQPAMGQQERGKQTIHTIRERLIGSLIRSSIRSSARSSPRSLIRSFIRSLMRSPKRNS